MKTKGVLISLEGELALSDKGLKNLTKGEEVYIYLIQRESKALYVEDVLDIKTKNIKGFPHLTNHYLGEELNLEEGSNTNYNLFGEGNIFHVLKNQMQGEVREREHPTILKLAEDESNFKGGVKVIDIPYEVKYKVKYDKTNNREYIREEPREWY